MLWAIALLVFLFFTIIDHMPFESFVDNLVYKMCNSISIFVLFVGFYITYVDKRKTMEKEALPIMYFYSAFVGTMNLIQIIALISGIVSKSVFYIRKY